MARDTQTAPSSNCTNIGVRRVLTAPYTRQQSSGEHDLWGIQGRTCDTFVKSNDLMGIPPREGKWFHGCIGDNVLDRVPGLGLGMFQLVGHIGKRRKVVLPRSGLWKAPAVVVSIVIPAGVQPSA